MRAGVFTTDLMSAMKSVLCHVPGIRYRARDAQGPELETAKDKKDANGISNFRLEISETLTPALSHRIGEGERLATERRALPTRRAITNRSGMGRIGLMGLMAVVMMSTAFAQAPRVMLGRNDDDKVLAKFWAQHGNASNTVVGLNANHGEARFAEDLLPTIIASRTLSGAFNGTNGFAVLTYNPGAERMERFDFNWLTEVVEASSNTVSRIGYPETLSYKVLDSPVFYNGGSYLSGILRANGANYATAIAGLAGTNTFVIGANTLTVVDGVVAGYTGSTNLTGTGLTTINGLSAAEQTFSVGTDGTDFGISSTGTNHTFNIPSASATSRGLLTAADWAAFSAKADNGPTLTALGAFNHNGLMTQISPNTFTGRLIVCGDGSLEVVNGDGVSGDIDIRLSSKLLYLPSDSAAPQDVPGEHVGKVPMIYDTTAHRLWIYDGGWRYASFALP